jgi:hypothetical protein
MVRPSLPYQGIARRFFLENKTIEFSNDSEREKYLSAIYDRDIDVSSALVEEQQKSTVEEQESTVEK